MQGESSGSWSDGTLGVWVRASDDTELAQDTRYLAVRTGDYGGEPCFIAVPSSAVAEPDEVEISVPSQFAITSCTATPTHYKTYTIQGFGLSVTAGDTTPAPVDGVITLTGDPDQTTYGPSGPNITIA